jgi:hypothetical protein
MTSANFQTQTILSYYKTRAEWKDRLTVWLKKQDRELSLENVKRFCVSNKECNTLVKGFTLIDVILIEWDFIAAYFEETRNELNAV